MRTLRRRLALFAPTAFAFAAALAASDAKATNCSARASTCIDSDALWFFAGQTTFFSQASSQTIAAKSFGFGLATSYQNDPIVFRTSAQGPAANTAIPAIGNQITTSFLFSYGITDRLQADLVAPVTFFQDGTGLTRLTGSQATDVPTSAVRDVRIGMAYALVQAPRVARYDGVSVVARFDLSLPSGDEDLFAGDRGLVAVPTIALEDRLGRFVFGANFGARLRKETTILGYGVGSQMSMSLGIAAEVDDKRAIAITAEIYALPSLVADGTSPVQWLGGLRWAPAWGGDLVLHGGAGSSFRFGRAEILESTFRATFDIRYEPRALDSDHDGVLDKNDKCPSEPEDRDGFQDDDGCPDPDNDKDGVLDNADRCPRDAGPASNQGCPIVDTDGDGVPDDRDKCPGEVGVASNDGCPAKPVPELPIESCADGTASKPGEHCDSDHDGVIDSDDMCPLLAEDKDGIADEDGCPEKDADEDGVGDQVDQCPLEPETINGVKDDDGCPEVGAHSLVKFEAGAIEAEKPVRFAAGSAVVTKPMKAQLAMMAQRAQGLVDRGVEKMTIETWGDKASDDKATTALAEKRAEAMKKAMVEAGIPEALIKARPGDLTDPMFSGAGAKEKANYQITVRTKRKNPIGRPPRTPELTTPPTTTPATTTPAKGTP